MPSRQFAHSLFLSLALVASTCFARAHYPTEYPPVTQQEAAWAQSLRHFDYFEADLRFPKTNYFNPKANFPMRVKGYFTETGGFFANCWSCDSTICTSEELCCGTQDPPSHCFDGLYFRRETCCNIFASDNHPDIMLQGIHVMSGVEQQYQRLTARRLEHLATLALPIKKRHVLELGAREGDLTHYFTDRGCNVTVVEPRHINIIQIRKKIALTYLFPQPERVVKLMSLDVEHSLPSGRWPVVLCLGLLYHLSSPALFLRRLAPLVSHFLLVETQTRATPEDILECAQCPSMALSGIGKRLPREHIFQVLKSLFPFVYVPSTQPNHEDFPIDWTRDTADGRAIFLASRRPLSSPVSLLAQLPLFQRRAA